MRTNMMVQMDMHGRMTAMLMHTTFLGCMMIACIKSFCLAMLRADPPLTALLHCLDDVAVRHCKSCGINRSYKGAPNRLLWSNEICLAHAWLIRSWQAFYLVLLSSSSQYCFRYYYFDTMQGSGSPSAWKHQKCSKPQCWCVKAPLQLR